MKGQTRGLSEILRFRVSKHDVEMLDALSNAWKCNWSEVLRRLLAKAHAEHLAQRKRK